MELWSKLEEQYVKPDNAYNLKWKDCPYSVKAGYSHLCSSNEMIDRWPRNISGKQKSPLRLYISAGYPYMKHALNRIISTEGKFRQSRAASFVSDSECNRHCFLHCPVAIEIWGICLSLLLVSNRQCHKQLPKACECSSQWKVDKSIRKNSQIFLPASFGVP